MNTLGNPPAFTYDTHGLDGIEEAFKADEILRAATEKNLATAGMTGVAIGVVEASKPENNLAPEVLAWANQEFSRGPDGSVFDDWDKYDAHLSTPAPMDLGELFALNPNLGATLTRLYQAKEEITATGERTPARWNQPLQNWEEGGLVGDTMHLVLVPWQELQGNLNNLRSWVHNMRATQAVVKDDNDFILIDLLVGLRDGTKLYRDPNTNEWLSTADYLRGRITQDGPWGVMLAQTGNTVGMQSLHAKSPNELTCAGEQHLKIKDVKVDGLGCLEWLTMSLQEDPETLILQHKCDSWLLANRLDDIEGDFSPEVPVGCWLGATAEVSTTTRTVFAGDSSSLPRLAVL